VAAATATATGYWEVAADGGIFAFDAPYDGSMGGRALNAPVVGMAEDPSTGGYWEVAADGGIFAFDAPYEGSMGGMPLNRPVVGMAEDPSTGGYWEVAADGGVFAFDAPYEGSMARTPLNSPIVGMAADPSTGGYWLVGSDGGVFAFNAPFDGSLAASPPASPIVGMAADPSTGGYWLVSADGRVYDFNAGNEGATGGAGDTPVVGMAADPATGGYWEVAADGGISAFHAPTDGSMAGSTLIRPMVGMAYSSAASTTTLLQVAPTSATVAYGAGYSAQLAVTGGTGAVTFTEATSKDAADVVVNSSGGVSAATSLTPGLYTVGGTDEDAAGDTGTWSFALTVATTTIVQTSPTSGTVTTATSMRFTSQLAVTGNTATVTYAETVSPASGDVLVSATGAVTTKGTLRTGTYTVSGTTGDTNGDTGTWTYTLKVTAVTISQKAPTAATTTTATSAGFSDQLTTTGGTGTVTFTESAGTTTELLVSPEGRLTTKGTLHSGTHTVSGTLTDPYGDGGTWTFTLSVKSAAVTQKTPSSATTTTTTSAKFTAQLSSSGSVGTATFAETAGTTTDVVVSSSGHVTTKGALHAGTYTVSGSDGDPYGDSGPWSYALKVKAVTIGQVTPLSGSTTPATSAKFTAQLATAGGPGTVTFTETTGATATLHVALTGAVTTAGPLKVGTYTVSGTDGDPYGDTGTWKFTLDVTAVPIVQGKPSTGTTTPANSGTFKSQLSATGFPGKVTFTELSGTTADVLVSSTGRVSTSGPLHAGTYTVSGSDKDGSGDTGTWSFTLHVVAVALTQQSPRTATVTTATSTPFHTVLTASGGLGKVTFTTPSGTTTKVHVAPTGAVTTSGTLHAGTYTVHGTANDEYGDSGTWTFTLRVTSVAISQGSPTSASVTTQTSSAFTDQLSATGGVGTVTFTPTGGTTTAVKVAPTGAVTTTGTLHAGTYTVRGTLNDSYGDTGPWSFTLKVTPVALTFTGPFTGTTDTATSSGFAVQLSGSGPFGKATFQVTGGATTAFVVKSTGHLSTSGPLAAGTHTVSGTLGDTYGDTGTWSFTLRVTPVAITFTGPYTDTTTTTASAAFADQLRASGPFATISFKVTGGTAAVEVSSTGHVSTTGTLSAGTHAVHGTMSDPYGDTGTWNFTLNVTAVTLSQAAPFSASTTTVTSIKFEDLLHASGGPGTASFVATGGTVALFSVSRTGSISTTGTLSAGTYTVSGTTSDNYGDTGTWTFTLHVTAVTITQAAPFSASTTTLTAATFTDRLHFSGVPWTVTFEVTGGTTTAVHVTSTGDVSTTHRLAAGTYTVYGSFSDGYGDTGTWSFTLHVTAVALSQTTPFTVSTTSTGAATVTVELSAVGGLGTYTYTVTGGTTTAIHVSADGDVSTSGSLTPGTYTVTGVVADTYGDSGSWSFTIHVSRSTSGTT